MMTEQGCKYKLVCTQGQYRSCVSRPTCCSFFMTLWKVGCSCLGTAPSMAASFINVLFFCSPHIFFSQPPQDVQHWHCCPVTCTLLETLAQHSCACHCLCSSVHSMPSHCLSVHQSPGHCLSVHNIPRKCLSVHRSPGHCLSVHSMPRKCLSLHRSPGHCLSVHSMPSDVCVCLAWSLVCEQNAWLLHANACVHAGPACTCKLCTGLGCSCVS